MKKSLVAAFLVFAVLCLAACSPDTQGAKTGGDVPSEYVPAPSPDGPVYEGTDISGSPFVGEFKLVYSAINASDASDVYADSVIPSISCRDDGTFTLTVNDLYGEGVFEIEGTFEVDGDTAVFSVESGLPSAFANSESFTMTMRNENSMRYSGSQIATTSDGDIFENLY